MLGVRLHRIHFTSLPYSSSFSGLKVRKCKNLWHVTGLQISDSVGIKHEHLYCMMLLHLSINTIGQACCFILCFPHVANKSSFNNAPLHKLVVQMTAVISVTSMSNEHATVYRQWFADTPTQVLTAFTNPQSFLLSWLYVLSSMWKTNSYALQLHFSH